MTIRKNSVDSDKLKFLDDIYVEYDKENFVKIGLKEDVICKNGNILTHFRYFKVNPRRN